MVHKPKMQIIKDELKRIEIEFHVLTPEAIVEAAKNPQSVLHGCFEWDNDKAADKYRLYEARLLVNYYFSMVKGVNVPAWESIIVNVSGVETKGYVSAEKILDNEGLKRQVRLAAYKEIMTLKKKYDLYKEVSMVFDETALTNLGQMVQEV